MRPLVRLITSAALLMALASITRAGTIKVFPDLGNTPIADALAQLQDGDKLLLHAGTYDERITLVDLSKVKVVGKGEVILEGAGPSASISVTNCDKIRIQGLILREPPTQGILINNSSKVVVLKCSVEEFTSQGIQISASEQVKVMKCTVRGGTNGIYVSGASVATIQRNTVSDQSGQGIFLVLVTLPGNRISRNTVSGSANAGIELSGVGNKADKNTVSECLFGVVTPFTGEDMSGSTILRNKVLQTTVALRTYASGGLAITGNLIEQASASAVQIASAAQDVVVSKNRVDGANAGIDDEGTGSVVSRNKLANTANYGIRARGDSGTFERNTVKDTTGNGFDVWTGGNTFNRNRATGNAGYDLDSGGLAEEANTYFKNTFDTVLFD